MGDIPFHLKWAIEVTHLPFQHAHFPCVWLHSGQAVVDSQKSSIIANRKSHTHFPTSHRPRSCVVPNSPKWGSKSLICRFSKKYRFKMQNVCYKVRLCINCQRESCRGVNLLFSGTVLDGTVPCRPTQKFG